MKLDGRYLASVDSSNANIAFIRDDEPTPVAKVDPPDAKAIVPVVPEQPGLVIMKHRKEEAFDLAAFAQDPSQFVEDFDRLSRDEDGDDWNAADRMKGKLSTHFDDEDLFIVRTQGGATLDVQWGDMPMVDFFREYLAVEPDAEGCYSSLSSQLVNDDGTPVTVPHRWFFCPKESVALFDIPDGYEVGLTATFKDQAIDKTRAGTSVADNFRLYAKEINPRSPRYRATGTVTGNIGAGFRDAGSDSMDVLRYAFTGTRPSNIHTGQTEYRASTLTAVPLALFSLAKLRPLDAVGQLLDGVDSTVMIAASAMSAVDNAVVNPVVQTTVGNAMSPEAADTTGHWFGAFTQAAAKNLPGAERNVDAISPLAAWQHNRGFGSNYYTRTDTQLNIDRIVTVLDAVAISAATRDSGSSNRGNGNDGGAGNPGGGGNPYTPPGGGDHGGMGPICKTHKIYKHKIYKPHFGKKHAFGHKFGHKKFGFKKHGFKKVKFHKGGFDKGFHKGFKKVSFHKGYGHKVGFGPKHFGGGNVKKFAGHGKNFSRCFSRVKHF
jgi:hypothetical protein